MRHFARSARWRRAFFAACLPFIVVSVFVESLHTGAVRSDGNPSWPAPAVTAGASSTTVQAAESDECPACNWLRLGQRLQNLVVLVRGESLVLSAAPPLVSLWPDSPVPHPALFRGPPRPVLS